MPSNSLKVPLEPTLSPPAPIFVELNTSRRFDPRTDLYRTQGVVAVTADNNNVIRVDCGYIASAHIDFDAEHGMFVRGNVEAIFAVDLIITATAFKLFNLLRKAIRTGEKIAEGRTNGARHGADKCVDSNAGDIPERRALTFGKR